MAEPTDFDIFLDNWEPGERLLHGSIKSYLFDPVAQQRMLEDSSGAQPLQRTPYSGGTKTIDENEKIMRSFDFIKLKQSEWSKDFRDRLLAEGLDVRSVDDFLNGFAQDWVDGRSRRQNSDVMLGIKASIRDLDRVKFGGEAERYVLDRIDENIVALFAPSEMTKIFEINQNLLEIYMADYIDILDVQSAQSINDLYIRRGVFMPNLPSNRSEKHHLSSYSLATGPVENFAQTWTLETRQSGVPCIFSAPLPAVQKRVVAFSAFIDGMDLSQLELVVAPPVGPTALHAFGNFGGIEELGFW